MDTAYGPFDPWDWEDVIKGVVLPVIRGTLPSDNEVSVELHWDRDSTPTEHSPPLQRHASHRDDQTDLYVVLACQGETEGFLLWSLIADINTATREGVAERLADQLRDWATEGEVAWGQRLSSSYAIAPRTSPTPPQMSARLPNLPPAVSLIDRSGDEVEMTMLAYRWILDGKFESNMTDPDQLKWPADAAECAMPTGIGFGEPLPGATVLAMTWDHDDNSPNGMPHGTPLQAAVVCSDLFASQPSCTSDQRRFDLAQEFATGDERLSVSVSVPIGRELAGTLNLAAHETEIGGVG